MLQKKTLALKQAQWQEAEAEKLALVTASKKELKLLQTKSEDLDSEIAFIKAQKDGIDSQLAEAQQIVTERSGKTSIIEQERADRHKLLAVKKELGAALAAAKEEFERQERLFIDQENAKKEIEALKSANDEMAAMRYMPDRAEAKEVYRELEEMKKLIQLIKVGTEKANLDKEAERLIEEKLRIEKEVDEINRFAAATDLQRADLQASLDEYKTSALLIQQLKEDAEIQKKEILQAEAEQKEREKECSDELKRKLKVLRRGASMLKKTAEKVKQVEAGDSTA